ncbi:hypothetical protein [Nocardia canadensis]|uniref:hypothetical protein n=1 Tax=Nocardia canadensis TaxID=3065238 RepID=UPI00292FD3D8|nr:hypothetical protein [Nocardia canadensis]
MLGLLGGQRRKNTIESCPGAATSAGLLTTGDVVLTPRRSFRVISTSFVGGAHHAGRVIADTIDLVNGRLRVIEFPSTDTVVTVRAS